MCVWKNLYPLYEKNTIMAATPYVCVSGSQPTGFFSFGTTCCVDRPFCVSDDRNKRPHKMADVLGVWWIFWISDCRLVWTGFAKSQWRKCQNGVRIVCLVCFWWCWWVMFGFIVLMGFELVRFDCSKYVFFLFYWNILYLQNQNLLWYGFI